MSFILNRIVESSHTLSRPSLGVVALGLGSGIANYSSKVLEGVIEKSEFIQSWNAKGAFNTAFFVAASANAARIADKMLRNKTWAPTVKAFATGAFCDVFANTLTTLSFMPFGGPRPTIGRFVADTVGFTLAGGVRNVTMLRLKPIVARARGVPVSQLGISDTMFIGACAGAVMGSVRHLYNGAPLKALPLTAIRSAVPVAVTGATQQFLARFIARK